MNNLASRDPARVHRLDEAWTAWAKRCEVIPEEPRKAARKSPQIAGRPLTIHCDVTPAADNSSGVLLAQGGDQRGYALYLKADRLVFGVREGGRLTEITSSEAVHGRFQTEARLLGDGAMTLAINGKIVARGKAPSLIMAQPQDDLSIGEDTRSAVGSYRPPNSFNGKVEGVRVQPGEIPESSKSVD